ncbi:hypothetical protein [Geobacter sp. AOG2]|uniref:hypothetical protein n=1 Tax=Geobacter sp. AOG2 TaxID=1566347 RepID=UPI001CC3A506|nr:hypothetical protein [Geobacter sp. AOG2]GFE61428.1 hypothetical protein AOG2_20150 [Geobacter sp. AOG2]
MNRPVLIGVIAVLTCLAAGCESANFLVYKDAKHFYVTSNGEALKKVLCESGDINRILNDSRLPEALQKELHEGICSPNKVKKRLLAILEDMTPEQRSALKLAFQTNGYEINNIANC